MRHFFCFLSLLSGHDDHHKESEPGRNVDSWKIFKVKPWTCEPTETKQTESWKSVKMEATFTSSDFYFAVFFLLLGANLKKKILLAS